MAATKKKIWKVKQPDIELSLRLGEGLGISPLLAQLLVNRGIKTEEVARAYLYPTSANLHDPFRMPNMEKAVDRIHSAIMRGEQIWIYGDYDTDGTTSAALLLNTFRYLDVPANCYIPDRFEEGYGLNKTAIRTIRESGGDLLITVDCGITSTAGVELANEIGLDVIITDHHQPHPDASPPAHAIISPKMPESEYPFDELAGVGLAFKLAHGLLGGDELTPFLISQLDLVTLGTVVDIATLTGENRVLTKLGLAEINLRKRPGIRALCDVANHDVSQPIVGHTLSFVLGPRMNAAGRMDTAAKVVELLTTESYEKAMQIAQELDANNRTRREVESRIQSEAIDTIEKDIDLNKTKGLVVAREQWHRGVIGIVASRLLERYYRPVFLLAIDGEKAHGSGRCIPEMNLADSLNACTDLLVKHGGNQVAAGLTIKTENIPKFKEHFNQYACEHLSDEDLIPKLNLDLEIQPPYLTLETMQELDDLLEPFGQDNPAPRLAMREMLLQRAPRLMGIGNEHLELFVTDGRNTMEAVGWRMSDYFIALKDPNLRLDLAFAPEITEWNSTRRLQLRIKDLQIHAEQVVDSLIQDAYRWLRDSDISADKVVDQLVWLIFLRVFFDKRGEVLAFEAQNFQRLPDGNDRPVWKYMPPAELLNFLGSELFKHLQTAGDDILERGLYKTFGRSFTDHHDPQSLAHAVAAIASIPLATSSERHGVWVALENLLSKKSAQFFTPCYIVDLATHLVRPQPGERIYDPCFGSASYLAEAAKKIHQASASLQPRAKTFFGTEISPSTFLIGWLNLILHDVTAPVIRLGDSLVGKKGGFAGELFDVIFATPPLGRMQIPTPTISIQTDRYELYFLQHIATRLKPGGRAAVILPEIVLFRSGRYREVRKWLLQNFTFHRIKW